MGDGEYDRRIYTALQGKIYEITARRDLYGEGGRYHFMAGKDATRSLAKMSFDPADIENATKLDDLNDAEKTCLQEWVDKFNEKYEVVGVLRYPKPKTDPAESNEAAESNKDAEADEQPNNVLSERVDPK